MVIADLTRTEIIKMIVAHGSNLNLRGVNLEGVDLNKIRSFKCES